MRRALLPLAALAAVLALAPPAGAGTQFVITGRGWGHGVGMSQWGAYGLARQGKTYQAILKHYYQETALDTSTGTIPVLLVDQRSSARLGSSAPFTVGGKTHAAGSPLVTRTSTGKIKVEGFTEAFTSPVTFKAGSAPLTLDGAAYRGRFVVAAVTGGIRVVNRVGLENYVAGVVTRESPSWWGDVGAQAALEAQAVAARSYARSGPGHCGGYYCPDTRDQVYGGVAGETQNGRDAVATTSRKVIVHNGSVARAFFYSSSGGVTASSADVWGGFVPYLRSVSDPADLNPDNPNRFWRLLRSPSTLRSQLDLAGTPNDVVVARDGSDRVASMTFSRPGWSQVVAYGDDELRARLGVKSTRFWLGVLRLNASRARVEWRQPVTLSAFVRRIANAELRRKRFDGAWADVQAVPAGETTRVARPRITTWFRLGSPAVKGVTVRIDVAPKLRITTVQSGSLGGYMRPRLAGTRVTVRKLVDGTWVKKGGGLVHGDGSWTAALNVGPGSYRAYAAPGNGYVAGHSPNFAVGA